jgi:hypothetical protein
LPGLLLQPRQRVGDLVGQALGQLALGVHVGHAGLGGDGEAGRNPFGAEDPRHLGDVGPFAAEEVAHLAGALGEVEDPGRLRKCSQGWSSTG